MKEHVEKIKGKAKELTELLGFDVDVIVVERGNVVSVNLQVDEPAVLIGRGGEGLESLQHMMRLLLGEVMSEIGSILVVDINGYRDKKASSIEKMAREIAHRVRTSGNAEELPPMNSFERRLVHTLVSTIADVESESAGDHATRRVVIKPKKK